MQLSRERPRLAQETPQFGFDHTPVGYAEIDDSGGVITVIADSSSCEASVAVELDDAASVTTTVDAASLASLPNEASLSTKLRGSLDGGADFQVAEILKQRQSTSSVEFSYSFHPDVVAPGDLVQYAISLDGVPVGDPVTATVGPILVEVPVAKAGHRSTIAGPGDPYNGIDVSIMGQTGTNGPGSWNHFRHQFDTPMLITVPGHSAVLGDAVSIVTNLGSSGMDGIVLHRLGVESHGMASFTLQTESTGHAPMTTLDGVIHTGLGNATFVSTGDTLGISNIGSSGQDGVAIDAGTASAISIGLDGPIWDDMPSGASLSDIFTQVGSTNNEVQDEQFIAYHGREKVPEEGSVGTVFRDLFGSSFLPPNGTVMYEALMSNVTVDSTLTQPGSVIVTAGGSKPGIALGPGDPYNGIDVSVASPDAWVLTTTWPTTFNVALPGRAPVVADGYRVTLTAPGTLPAHIGAVRVVGKDLGSFNLVAPNYTLDAVTDGDPGLPRVTRLLPNTPNPFNPMTRIRFDLARPGPVTLRIYDARGRLIDTLVRGPQDAGRHVVVWNGRDARRVSQASGVYFYTIRTHDEVLRGKMTLLK
jgi:hypothetical protein